MLSKAMREGDAIMFPPMNPMGERVRFQNEVKELERRASRPIRFSLVSRLKALVANRRPVARDVVARRPLRRAEPPTWPHAL
jgi:hypothetical protein